MIYHGLHHSEKAIPVVRFGGQGFLLAAPAILASPRPAFSSIFRENPPFFTLFPHPLKKRSK